MQKKNLISKILPVLVLFFLSPVIAELLSGSTPASRAEQLIFESVFYGSAVLLIREIARRYNLGWFSIILLGFAFGIIEEGLLLQSVFNAHFLNFDIAFGRFWGVNWAWSEIIIGNHAIWSITLPVLISELIFADKNTQPWLNKTGVGIFMVLFLLSSFAFCSTFYKMSGFSTSWIHYTTAAFLTVTVITIAFNLPKKSLVKYQFKTPASFVIGIVSFLVSSLWLNLLSLVFKKNPEFPAWLIELSGIFLIAAFLFVVMGWINSKWSNIQRFALAGGALYAGMVFGLIILIQSKNNLDIICQICFMVITSILLILLGRKILNSDSGQVESK